MTATPVEIARRALADHLAALPPAELLKRYATRRDPEAFAGLVQQFGPMVLGTCRRVLGSSADVDDAFQAVFLSLARQADSFRDAQALPAWLHRVSLRVSHKALARRAPASAPPESVPDPSDPYADVAWKDVRRVLDEELDALPEKYRGPVVLCWLDGLTQDEAAGRLGVSLATLKRRLEAARELLRTRLVRRGLTPVLVAAAVLDATGLRADVPEALKVLAVELGVGGVLPSGVAGLEVLVLASAPTRRVVLAALLGAGVAAAGGLAYAWTRSRSLLEVSTTPPPPPRRVTAPRTRLALKDPDGRVPSVAWTPDGKRIATGIGGTVRLWDAHTGKEVAAPLVGAHVGTLHPGGNLLASRVKDGSIKVWDLEGRKEYATLKPPNKFITGPSPAGLVWSPDGKTLTALGKGPALCLWDIATQQSRTIEIGGYSSDGDLSYSPNGKFLAVSRGGPVQFWDVTTATEIAEHFLHRGAHFFHAHWWSEDSATFFLLDIGGQPNPLKSFNLVTRSEKVEDLDLGTWRAEEGRAPFLTWSGDGNVCAWEKMEGSEYLVLVGDWRARRVWAVGNYMTVRPEPKLGSEPEVYFMSKLSHDGTTLMTFLDGDILLWDVGDVPPKEKGAAAKRTPVGLRTRTTNPTPPKEKGAAKEPRW